MHPLRRKIPSLTALTAFEAAARHESFTRSAMELGITQAAISRRIKSLEQDLGCPLFTRANRRVVLNVAGRTLYDATKRSFDTLADAVGTLSAPAVDITVAVSVAFAHFRLLPALSQFRALAPEVGLRVISEDRWIAPEDAQIDIAVRYGRPPFRGMRIAGALPETIIPVCAPAVATLLRGKSLTDLTEHPDIALIEGASTEPHWLTWAQWLRQTPRSGRLNSTRLQFSSYSDAIYAAMDGQGVALGWTGILARPLGDGRLCALDLPVVAPEERHYILVPDRGTQSPASARFVRWMEATLEPT